MSAVADVLRAAADRLERTGLNKDGWYWDQRQLVAGTPRGDIPACVIGALKDLLDSDAERVHSAECAVIHYLDGNGVADSVANWSDSHSLDEVVAGLRAAADGAE